MAPTRPLASNPVATDWGQAVHDTTFTPIGCVASSAAGIATAVAVVKASLTVGGPNLSVGSYIVPAGGAGVYKLEAAAFIVALGTATTARVFIYKNGVQQVTGGGYQTALASGRIAVTAMLTLSVGDSIEVWVGVNTGTTTTITAYLQVIRIGESLV